MIPNHLIREILVAEGFKLHDINGDQDLKPYVYNGFRKCLTEARKVKPLEFIYHEDVHHWMASGMFGQYMVSRHTTAVYLNGVCIGKNYDCETSAIEAANKHHADAVLSQLVYGGGEA